MGLLNEIISSNKKQYKSSLRDYVMSQATIKPKITRFASDVPIDEQRLALIGEDVIARDVPPKRETILSGLIRDAKQSVQNLIPKQMPSLLPSKFREDVPVEELNLKQESESGLTGFIYPPIEKRKRQFTKEGAEFITGTLEKALLPFTAPITVGANILQGLIREIKGKGSKGNIDAIGRIMAANPQPGDQIFVADLLKEVGITDESASLPEGTIDRIGFIADWPLFGGVAKLQKMLANTLTSKFPAKTFNNEIKIILENSIGKTANTPEEESIKTQFVEPVLKSIRGTKKIKSVAPTIEPKLPVEPVKNVIPEEGKGTGEAFRPTLKEEVIVPRETIKIPVETPFDTAPNLSIHSIVAKKQSNGKFKLLFRGTSNEVFQGEEFKSASEARQFFKAQKLKAKTRASEVPVTQIESVAAKETVPRETIKPEGTGKAIYHFTKKENIENILKEGFDTNLPPIHGTGALQKRDVYTAENKSGKGVLYFTTDTERWNKAQVYTGEGKGTKDYSYYDYNNQKWVTEKKALTTIDLSPLKATIKQEANILVIDSMKKYLAFQKEHLGTAFPKDRMAEVINLAKGLGYDILNVKYKPKEWIFNKQDFYEEVTGAGGKDDYFVFNKDIIDYSLAKGKEQTTVPRETIEAHVVSKVGELNKIAKKSNIDAESYKEGVLISEKPSTRAPTIKQLADKSKTRDGIITGKVSGEDFYSDGSILIKGLTGKDIKISKSKPNFKEVIPSATLEETKPVGYQIINDIGIVWLDNKQAIQAKYYDHIKKKYPDIIFKSTGGGNNAIKLYNKDEFVGVLMPTESGAVMPELQANIGGIITETPILAVGSSVKVGKSPQVHTITSEEPFNPKTDIAGERFFNIKNNKTGEIQLVSLEDLKLVKSKKPTLTLNQLVKDPDKINDILANPALYDAKTVANAKRLKSEGGFFRFPSKKKKQVLSEIEQYNKAVDGIKGKWWQFRKTFQDEFIFAKKLQDFVSKGNKIPEDINIDHARRLFDGRVHTRIQGLFDDVFKIEGSLTESSKRFGVSRDNLSEFIKKYMHAKHAPERNRVLRKPKAAGISDADADIIIKQIEAYPFANDIKKLADEYWKINRRTLKILHEAELIEDATYNLLSSVYKYHSPLRRITKDTDDITHILSGKGFDVRTSGLKRAKGSEKPIADIIENIIVNAQEAIIRAEKNIVGLYFLRFARTHKGTGLFKEIKPKVIGTTFTKPKGFIKQQINDPQVLTIMEKGKPTHLFIEDKRLALALKGVEVEHIPAFLKPVAFLTRLYAGLHTRFNYDFAMPNNIRDIPEMLVDISSRKDMGGREALKAAKKAIISSKKDIWDALMGKDTPGARLYKQMKLDGGTTGGLGLSTREQVVVSLEKIRKLYQSKPRMATFKLLKLIDNWNIIFEDSTRLSVYKTALDKGLSRNHAAFLAKEASINFNKHGTAGPIINSLYMFSNASIQGQTRMLRAMIKNPKVAAATISSIGAAVFAVDRWNKFIDPDYKKKLNKWERTNLTILLPTEDFRAISIPMSLGLKPIKVVWEYASDVADGEGDIQDALKGIATAVFEAYNPLAGDEDIVNTLIPSIGKVPVEIARNRAWYGNKIRPDWDVYLPDSASYFPSLAEKPEGAIAIKATEFLSDKNIMEISPANIVYAFNQYIGGAGRSIKNIISAVSSAGKSELPNRENIPILNRFIKGKSEDEIIQQMFYANKDKISKEKKETAVKDLRRVSPVYETIQTLIKEGKQDEARVLLNGMTDYDYGIYKKLTERDKRQETRKNQITVFPKYEHIQELLKQGNEREARIILNELSDDEYKTYKTLVKQFSNN